MFSVEKSGRLIPAANVTGLVHPACASL